MGRRRQDEPKPSDVGVGGVFRGLGNFLDLLSNLTEQEGGEFTRSGEIGGNKKGLKAVYGFSLRVGAGGKPSIERFGNVKEHDKGPVVEEEREPMVDVFDEGDHLLVIAELPGVNADDISFKVEGDMLNLMATHGQRKYRKEVLLSDPVASEAIASSYRNGVFELKLRKER